MACALDFPLPSWLNATETSLKIEAFRTRGRHLYLILRFVRYSSMSKIIFSS